MEDAKLMKVVSMIIQDLRKSNLGRVIEVIKKSEYSLDYLDHDNWNGGIDFYRLTFHLKYCDFVKLGEIKKEYEGIIKNSVDKFYNDEYEIISEVTIVSKIDLYVDWAAITQSENKNSLLKKLQHEKEMLIQVGTGKIIIKNKIENEAYIEEHQYICSILEQLGLSHVNNYSDLWKWYSDYKERQLNTYQSRINFINNLYAPLFEVLENSEESKLKYISYEPTGWENIDDSVCNMKSKLLTACQTEDYQAVGMYGRELLITLAKTVFDKDKHPSSDGIDIGPTDSKRMLEAYIHYCLKHKSGPREVKFAKAAIDFSNELTHRRAANSMDAELCFNAVVSTVNIIRVIYKYNESE